MQAFVGKEAPNFKAKAIMPDNEIEFEFDLKEYADGGKVVLFFYPLYFTFVCPSEIIAFHNCADSYEAHKKEQEYFETLGATLNSIEPLPKPKFKDPVNKIIKEKPVLFCQSCNIYLTSRKTQDAHNKTNKHHKSLSINKILSYGNFL